MGDRIRITGLEVFAHHGVLASEKVEGQTFVIDVDMILVDGESLRSDNLAATVDYGVVSQAVHDLVAGSRFDLIEKVAEEVALLVLEDARVDSVDVTVHKPNAPIAVPFADVSVTVRRP